MTFFQFEADFVDNLRCIPMQVRYNLDNCGIKLKLSDWNHFSPVERQQLVECPCQTAREIQDYREKVQQFVLQHGGTRPQTLPLDPTPEWENTAKIPDRVQEQCHSHHIILNLPQWASLTPLQRFALIKLSRANHENRNFLPALQEFGLIESADAP